MNKKQRIIMISVITIVCILSIAILLFFNYNTREDTPSRDIPKYIDPIMIEKIVNGKIELDKVPKNFDGIDISIKSNKKNIKMGNATLDDYDINYGIVDPELGVSYKDFVILDPKDDFLVAKTEPVNIEADKTDSLVFGIYNNTDKPQYPGKCEVKYIQYSNGTNLDICGITIGSTQEEIENIFGKAQRSDMIYKFTFDGHLYQVKFTMKDDKCEKIEVDIDGYVEHREY